MAELNEAQLMQLSNLMYIVRPFPEGFTVEQVLSEVDVDSLSGSPGGMTKTEIQTLIGHVQSDPEICSLAVHAASEGELGAVCLVDPAGDATIVYRGTSSNCMEWNDDVQGGMLSDTRIQQMAYDFAAECAADYDNITVTGHSKGGNMAQYVTVRLGDEVDRCVSYDGQGFGDEFLMKYTDEIKAASPKIRSVNAYNDFVNTLLYSIAGETIYLENKGTGVAGSHRLYDVIFEDKNVLGPNGEYRQARNQSITAAGINTVLDTLVLSGDVFLRPEEEFLLYAIVGAILGTAMGKDVSLDDLLLMLTDSLKSIVTFNWDEVMDKITVFGRQTVPVSCRGCFNTDAMLECSQTMASLTSRLQDLESRLGTLKRQMATNLIGDVTIGVPLNLLISRVERNANKLNLLATTLRSVAQTYETTESTVRNRAQI